MKRITVLLSTYNGQKYLSQLLDSVLLQRDVEVNVIVRDDGSSDETKDILENYRSSDDRVTYYLGSNIGPAMSFVELIQRAGDSDYYAFCDQDDVWLEEKLVSAVKELEHINGPALYHSNLHVVDRDLNYIREMHDANVGKCDSKYTAFIENYATGCTMVFNRALMALLRKGHPNQCIMHDMWVNTVASMLGTVVYDKNAYILYRQHDNNVVGTNTKKKSIGAFIIQKMKRLNDYNEPRLINATEFWKIYKDDLAEDEKEKVYEITSYKNNLKTRVKLLFDKDIHSKGFASDIKYRMLVIAGRI